MQRESNPVLYKHLFSPLAAKKSLVNLEPKVFASQPTNYLSEIDVIHPLREDNGGLQRIFISQLAEQAGYPLDYLSSDQADLYPAMQASFLGNKQTLSDLIFKDIACFIQFSCIIHTVCMRS